MFNLLNLLRYQQRQEVLEKVMPKERTTKVHFHFDCHNPFFMLFSHFKLIMEGPLVPPWKGEANSEISSSSP